MPRRRPAVPTARLVDRALRQVSHSANHGRLWLGLAAVGLLIPGVTRRAVVRGVASLAATSFVANALLKPLTRRRRPLLERTPIVRQLSRQPRSTSFPSGHAASAAAFATGVALERPAIGAMIAPLAVAVGYSRVHVGVHHVSDVVVGAAVGAGIALASQHWWPVRPDAPSRARSVVHAPALPAGQGLVVVVNPRSGASTYPIGRGDRETALRDSLPDAEFVELAPGIDLDTELDRRATDARAFGVAGGDGTVAVVAAAALRHNLPLAVFPAGTLNHFARDVGLESFGDTVRALAAGAAVAVDIAVVNGVPFLNTAVIGSYPEMVRRRRGLESKIGKWPAMAVAVSQVLRRQTPVRLALDGRPTAVWTLFVGNGEYTPRGPFPAWRPRLDDGQLDVQYLRAGVPFSRTLAVLATLAGLAERHGAYRARLVGELSVDSLSGPVEIAHDGERGERAESFWFGKLPGKLVIYRPDTSVRARES